MKPKCKTGGWLYVFCTLFLSVTLLCSTPGYAQTKANYFAAKVPADHDFKEVSPNAVYKPNHLLVRFTSDGQGIQKSQMAKQSIVNSLGGNLKRSVSAAKGLYLVELPETLSVEDALEIYNAREDILYAEPDYQVKTMATFPNDTRFSELWGMHNTGQLGGTVDADIDAPEVWDIRTNADNIIVAVIDTGVDYTHEDLQQNMWVNEAELNGTPGVDDDGNGYIDDIHGYDFAYYDADPYDGHFHGTHCAGTIGAVGNNGKGVVGVCWNVKIMAVKFLDDGGYGSTEGAVLAVQYATRMGAKIMSNSWGGGGYSQSLKDAIDEAAEAGILFIAAAGNSGSNNDLNPHYPSSYTSENIISVMATDRNDVRSIWVYPYSSCYGATSVDIAAPGSDILSCVPGNQYGYLGGTSMATPHVSGACALVWSMNPGMSYVQVKNTILDSADRLDSLQGLCVTEARLNIFKAIPLGLSIESDIDENECLPLNGEIVYTVNWSNPTSQTFYDASIVLYLDKGLSYPAGFEQIVFTEPNDPNAPFGYYLQPPAAEYDSSMHALIYEIGTIFPDDSGEITISGLYLNTKSQPGLKFITRVELRAEDAVLASASEENLACCWDTIDPDIIYVDASATYGNQNGVDWANSYLNLQDALYRAKNSSCPQDFKIFVASGTYSPGSNEGNTFRLENVSLYSGFPAGGCPFEYRSPKKHKAVLTGKIDDFRRNQSVVTITGENVLVDGVTISDAGFGGQGIYCAGFDFTLRHSIIQNNLDYGIRAINCNLDMEWCYIRGNRSDGIRHNGSEKILSIENCWIMKNLARGVATQDSTPYIRNSILTESDLSEYGNPGIRILNPSNSPVLHGCTFAHNRSEGVFFSDDRTISDPNDKDWPDVQNCIMWYNNVRNNSKQFSGFTKQHVHHSAIYDPNDPNGEDLTLDFNSNFSANPQFVYVDPNFLYLRQNSPCKDAGNPLLDYTGQADFAGRSRVIGNYADVGAYEIIPSEEPDSHEVDWNHDGQINLWEFSLLSKAWGSVDPNCPEWLADPNLADPNLSEGWYDWKYKCNINQDGESAYTVDFADFLAFVDSPWLWRAYWLPDIEDMQMQQMMSGGGEMLLMGGDFGELEGRQMLSEPLSEPQVSVEEQITQLQQSLVFLARIWLEEPDIQQEIDAESWQEFMTAVYQNLLDLQAGTIQLE